MRARTVEVVLDGLRPTLVADLRIEVIGAAPGAAYDLGPVFERRDPDGAADAGASRWLCLGEGCSAPVDVASELYPMEFRYALDQAAERPELVRPLQVRFELREVTAGGAARVVEATDRADLQEVCARLARVPLDMRRIARDEPGVEGAIDVRAIHAVAGCEGPVLHAEIDHRVTPLSGTRPVVRISVGLPGGPEALCEGPHCVVELEPPDAGSVVIQKPLGRSFAALARSAARAEVHLFLERRPARDGRGGGPIPPVEMPTGPLDHHVYELVSPGAGMII